MNIQRFIERHDVTFKAEPVPENPNMPDMVAGSAHWLCQLQCGTRTMHTYFSKGPGLRVWRRVQRPGEIYDRPKGWRAAAHAQTPFFGRVSVYGSEAFQAWTDPEPPTVEEVLDCVASDASSHESSDSFEDWAAEFGLDTDSRKAERIYEACRKQARDLRRLLGVVDYEFLLNNVERL